MSCPLITYEVEDYFFYKIEKNDGKKSGDAVSDTMILNSCEGLKTFARLIVK